MGQTGRSLVCSLLLCTVVGAPKASRAQDEPITKPLVIYLDQDHTRFLKFGALVQIWARHTQMNPGSKLSEGGLVQEAATDVSVRRFRVSMDAQLSERTMGFFQLGVNNMNYISGRGAAVELLDAYAEYKVSDAFSFGGGKSVWNALSRYSGPSAARSLTLDVPVVPLPTMNITDAVLRKLGVWAKGQVSRLDYRATVFKPFAVQGQEPGELEAAFTDDGLADALGVAAYAKWQFFEQESNRLPTSPGTYLGQKKVLALGIGFEYQQDRTVHLEQGEPVLNDLKLWAADVFLDLPFGEERRTALTAYAALFDYDFGPNSVRNIGVNNPAQFVDLAEASLNGAGNAYPLVGSGQTFYVQAGFLSPSMGGEGLLGRLQPFADLQSSKFDGLDDRMNAWRVGVHWLIRGHRSRLSAAYQSRPVFVERAGRREVAERKGMAIVQFQLWLN
jgi:hypothetical protein